MSRDKSPVQSGFQTPIEEREAENVMSVVMDQPHRHGVSSFPGDAWMATALGRFCRIQWNDKDTQKDRWDAGERYAQLVDDERISHGLKPRQCAISAESLIFIPIDEQLKRRAERKERLSDANGAMGGGEAVKLVYRLAYDDEDIWSGHWIVKVALGNLYAHFERFYRVG